MSAHLQPTTGLIAPLLLPDPLLTKHFYQALDVVQPSSLAKLKVQDTQQTYPRTPLNILEPKFGRF